MQAEFRPAQARDREPLVAMMRELAEQDGTPFDPSAAGDALERLMQDGAAGAVRVIEVAGQAVGYLVVTFGYSLEFHGRDAFVDELFVRPEWRGRGLGRRALEVAVQICREHGARALHLEVERTNERALRLYHSAGFLDHDRFLLTRWIEPLDSTQGEQEAGELVRYCGGCHCGRVRFELRAAARPRVQRCNCSRCRMTGFLHLIVPKARFALLQGEEHLSRYSFNTGVAQHLFCRVCGIQSFYVPRSNPDGFDVDLRCLDAGSCNDCQLEEFDGQHWEEHAAALAHLSREEPDA